ncbi:hypothetical protein [Mesorhizobium sp. WSM3868]|uniref:hypothetical protein n=1 Tax=Mesorhizobium sp. WSM3868 TaxID=2029405 RepID=UPI0015CE5224|nr:hypothetical protein [Mesorhizobium sp. WSM3868]
MDRRGKLIANHKAEIVRLSEEVEFERTHPHELADEIFADNLRMIATLEAIVARAEAGK